MILFVYMFLFVNFLGIFISLVISLSVPSTLFVSQSGSTRIGINIADV